MVTQQRSIEIDRPIDEVFEYTNNNTPEWSLTVVEDEPLEIAADGGVGTTFRLVTEENGRRMEFAGTVIRYEFPTLCAVELIGRQFDIEAEYTFEDLGGRTRVTQTSQVRPKKLIMKLIFKVCGSVMNKASCKALDDELASLKQHAEAQP